jgi:hypothetical protein
MTPGQRSSIDWPRLLADIAYLIGEPQLENPVMRNPVGTRLLADHLQVTRGALRNWQEGSEPRHSEGERLIAVWCSLTGKAEGFAPITVRSFSARTAKAL